MHVRRILGGWILWTALAANAAADSPKPRLQDVRSVFFVARSTNKNQVHYGVHVDAACRPVGTEPIYGYWRMLENRGELEPILAMEQPAYGVGKVELVEGSGSPAVRVRLRAFPERQLLVTIDKSEGGCAAVATTTIGGAEARLSFVYVKLKWPFGIDYILLRGSTLDGRPIQETIRN
jgi:hypothetical protein